MRVLLIYSWIPFFYSCIFQGYLGAGEFFAPAAAGLLDRNQVSALLSLVAEEGGKGGGLYILPRKCAAGFRGDRLCLLQMCHTANGHPGAGWPSNVEEKHAGQGLPPCFILYTSTTQTDLCMTVGEMFTNAKGVNEHRPRSQTDYDPTNRCSK